MIVVEKFLFVKLYCWCLQVTSPAVQGYINSLCEFIEHPEEHRTGPPFIIVVHSEPPSKLSKLVCPCAHFVFLFFFVFNLQTANFEIFRRNVMHDDDG